MGRGAKEIKLHARWWACRRTFKARVRTVQGQCARQCKELRATQEGHRRRRLASESLRADQDAELAEFEARRQMLHRELGSAKLLHDFRKSEAEKARRRLQKEEDRLRSQEDAERKRYLDAQKRNLEAWGAEQAMARRVQAIHDQERERLENFDRADRATLNKERVDFRDSAYMDKVHRRRAMDEARRRHQKRIQEYLDELREQVAPSVGRCAARAAAQTASSAGHSDPLQKYQEPRNDKSMYGSSGYTDAQLFRDRRFKIMHRLREAGAHKTSYARHIVSRLSSETRTNASAGFRHANGVRQGQVKLPPIV